MKDKNKIFKLSMDAMIHEKIKTENKIMKLVNNFQNKTGLRVKKIIFHRKNKLTMELD
jgi:hypothetical protein